jgi:hypothetical protein
MASNNAEQGTFMAGICIKDSLTKRFKENYLF